MPIHQADNCVFVDVVLLRKGEMTPNAIIHYSLVRTVQNETTRSFSADCGFGGKSGRVFTKITCEVNFMEKQLVDCSLPKHKLCSRCTVVKVCDGAVRIQP